MTKGERRLHLEAKRQLVAAGVLPPPKKRINRKKYIEQAWAEFAEQPANTGADAYVYLVKAISAMTSHLNRNTLNLSPEAVGAAKVLKLAAAIRAFEEDSKKRGETPYKMAELQEVINPILLE